MILELDAGNSRIKWRMLTGDGPTGQRGVLEHEQELECRLRHLERPCRVRVANVRGQEFADTLTRLLRQHWDMVPEFASVATRQAGVRNAYRDPLTLGVDRWVAILAAYHRCTSACCVVDCGSAITVDWVDKEGLHQGGYIVPGLELMQRALSRGTQLNPAQMETPGCRDPGRSTEEAVGRGIPAMVAGWLNGLAEQPPVSRPALYLTGGDADRLVPYLDPADSWIVVPELVLDGLVHAVP